MRYSDFATIVQMVVKASANGPIKNTLWFRPSQLEPTVLPFARRLAKQRSRGKIRFTDELTDPSVGVLIVSTIEDARRLIEDLPPVPIEVDSPVTNPETPETW